MNELHNDELPRIRQILNELDEAGYKGVVVYANPDGHIGYGTTTNVAETIGMIEIGKQHIYDDTYYED